MNLTTRHAFGLGFMEQLQPHPGGVALIGTSPSLLVYAIGLARRRRLGVGPTLCSNLQAKGTVAHNIEQSAAADCSVIGVILESVEELRRVGAAIEYAVEQGRRVVVLDATPSTGVEEAAVPVALLKSRLSASGAHYTDDFLTFVEALYTLHHARRFPAGGRVCILTGSGGVGVLMADEAERIGLDLAAVPESGQARLHEIWPLASVRNPVDTTAQVINNPAMLAEFLTTVLEAGHYDATVSFMTHIGLDKEVTDRRRIPFASAAAAHPEVVNLVTLLTTPEVQGDFEADGLLVYEEPFDALAAVVTLAEEGRRQAARAARGSLGSRGVHAEPAVSAGRKDPAAWLRADGAQIVDGPPDEAPVVLQALFVEHPRAGRTVTIGFAGRSETLGPVDELLVVAPTTILEARVLLGQLAAAKVFAGVRGSPAVDLEACAAALVRLAMLADTKRAFGVRIGLFPATVGIGVAVVPQG